MNRSNVLVVLAAAMVAVVAGVALTAPKPAEIPTSWQLDLTFQPPHQIQVVLPGDSRPSTFWYFRYTVTNGTDAEQRFVPDFVLSTDTGQVLRAGQGVSPFVFEAVKEKASEPLLKDQTNIAGPLLRGADNAKEGVAIFTDIDPEAGAFDLFVGGLSGETSTIKPPLPVISTSYGKSTTKTSVTLSKTLGLNYKLPGEASARATIVPQLVDKTWVMR